MRKIIGGILVTLLLISAVTGCSSRDNQEIETEKDLEGELSMGRYVEESLVLPEGIAPNEFVSITAAPNGEIELYAFNDGSYEKYLYREGTWSKEETEALQEFNKYEEHNFMIQKVFYGEDKKQYLLGNTMEYCNALYRLSEAGVFEKVELKRFEDTNEEWGNMPYRPNVLKVLKNGMIAAAYPWRVLEVYSSDGQSVLQEYNCGRSCLLAAEGNTIYYADQNDKEVLSVNIETKEEGSPRPIEINTFDTAILEMNTKTAYIGNSSGIHQYKEGGSLWETLIDGSQCSLSMPSNTLTDIVIGPKDEYYIVLSNTENRLDITLKHIFYDENISSVPPIELSIFSIEDNPTIRQAIPIFQEMHPEVRVNFRNANVNNKVKYTYGIKDPEQTVTLKDQINALNTELLAGRGADILVLDGMPIDSYIDKGVLEDMGSIFTSMKASGELLPNITDPYYLDKKVYAMPIRFMLPVIYGSLDAVNAANSIQELAEYAHSNSDTPLLAPSNYRALAAWLIMTNYDQITDQGNEIDEAALQNFLKTVNSISEAIHASDDVEADFMNSNKGRTWGYWVSGAIRVHKQDYQTNIEEIGGFGDLAIIAEVVQKWQGAYKAINNSYKPNTLIGLNSAGSQKELAKEFIQLLFSEDIQRIDLMDGFPVNQAAIKEWVKIDKEGYGYSVGDGEYTVEAFYPKLETREHLYETICSVAKPMVNDLTLVDMILDEAERYLRGDITAEQAASNAVSSIHLYQSE